MIGERLEEARKRKGVSIREVAEATKIRGDYLLAMEDNSFEIPLPQIYIRGFLKNYARFLKLDSNKVLTDYDAHLLGKSNRPTGPTPRSGERGQSLGRVEFNDQEVDEEGGNEDERVVITEAPEDDSPDPELTFDMEREKAAETKAPPRTLKRESSLLDQETWNENKALYLKIGLVFVSIILVGIILVILIQMIGGKGDSPELNPELATQQTPSSTVVTEPSGPAVSVNSVDSILISASDNLTLIVEQTLDRKRLYSGTLNAGETLSLEKEGPVSIRYSNGSALVVEKDGQRFTPQQTGVGRTVID